MERDILLRRTAGARPPLPTTTPSPRLPFPLLFDMQMSLLKPFNQNFNNGFFPKKTEKIFYK